MVEYTEKLAKVQRLVTLQRLLVPTDDVDLRESFKSEYNNLLDELNHDMDELKHDIQENNIAFDTLQKYAETFFEYYD